ncbi:AlpA family phage regulatory protein [Blautia producta]
MQTCRIVTKRLHLYQSMSEEIFPRSVHLSERRAKTYLSKQHEVP